MQQKEFMNHTHHADSKIIQNLIYIHDNINVIFAAAPPIQEAQDHGKHTLLINILTVVLGAMFFVAAIIVVMICKKLKREKEQKQLAIETARAVIVTHWTKKVTVEKPQMNGSPTTTGEALVSNQNSFILKSVNDEPLKVVCVLKDLN